MGRQDSPERFQEAAKAPRADHCGRSAPRLRDWPPL